MGKTGVIIVAAGSGTRMNSLTPKQFMMLNGVPVLVRTVRKFFSALPQCSLVTVVERSRIGQWQQVCSQFGVPQHKVTAGGKTRFESVAAGLEALDPDCDLVAVHDGARPLVSIPLIRELCRCAAAQGTAVPAVEPADSFRMVTPDGSRTVDRRWLRAVQTPQMFRADILRRAYGTLSPAQGFTDDASAAEAIGAKIVLVEGEPQNIKITRSADMKTAEALLSLESDE